MKFVKVFYDIYKIYISFYWISIFLYLKGFRRFLDHKKKKTMICENHNFFKLFIYTSAINNKSQRTKNKE